MKTYKAAKHYSLKVEDAEFVQQKITSSESAKDFAMKFYFDDIEIFESFFIILLNRNNVATGFAKISQGGTAGTVVDTKIIAKYAVDTLCQAVILVHNHPSGNKLPSEADRGVTRKVSEGLDLLDIKVFDHIILTKKDYYSFADNGIM